MVELRFKGKQFVQNNHLVVKYHELIPRPEKSLTTKVSLHDNLIIHGDNLKALKALLPTYAGKVKCIYIDPPYNTGNEGWRFNDNGNSPMLQDWLGQVVARDDLTRHDKWLCMMMPRLKLLRDLLRDDGVIFVSIDDNEVHHLKMLMDEVFLEEHFVGAFIWRKKEGGGQTDKYFVTEHEYILVYEKTNEFEWKDEIIPEDESRYNKEDERGKYYLVKLAKWGNTARREDRPKMYFALTAPDGTKVHPKAPDGSDGRWRVGKGRAEELIENGLIGWEQKGEGWVPYEKVYYEEGAERVIKERSIIYNVANTADGANELTAIFGAKDVFENPKPSKLVAYLLAYTSDSNSLVLDSFAGSGTTGHAVLGLNKEDGGNRKFILVECEDYAEAKDPALGDGLGGTFSYFELGDPIEIETLLAGEKLPTFEELARYVFYTATAEEFEVSKIDEESGFIGETPNYRVYLFYKPDIEYLKRTALTLERAAALGPPGAKTRLVFAPTKYLNQDQLEEYKITFAQLPFEIYRLAG